MRDSALAKSEFEHALKLARSGASELDSPWKAERKALRGLGAAHQQLADYPKALDAMMEVLKISEKMEDQSGISDAIGVIADIYTDKGDVRCFPPARRSRLRPSHLHPPPASRAWRAARVTRAPRVHHQLLRLDTSAPPCSSVFSSPAIHVLSPAAGQGGVVVR